MKFISKNLLLDKFNEINLEQPENIEDISSIFEVSKLDKISEVKEEH